MVEEELDHATIISGVTDDDILLAGNTSDWFDMFLYYLLTDEEQWLANRSYIQLRIVRLDDAIFENDNCPLE